MTLLSNRPSLAHPSSLIATLVRINELVCEAVVQEQSTTWVIHRCRFKFFDSISVDEMYSSESRPLRLIRLDVIIVRSKRNSSTSAFATLPRAYMRAVYLSLRMDPHQSQLPIQQSAEQFEVHNFQEPASPFTIFQHFLFNVPEHVLRTCCQWHERHEWRAI